MSLKGSNSSSALTLTFKKCLLKEFVMFEPDFQFWLLMLHNASALMQDGVFLRITSQGKRCEFCGFNEKLNFVITCRP